MNMHGYGFTFPFPIICSHDHSNWPQVTRKIGGINVEIHPPFLSGKNARLTADFDINASPSFQRRKITIGNANLPVGGFRTVPSCWSADFSAQPQQLETNSFQVECYTGSERRADKILSWIIKAGLRNLRRASGQFWIEHPAIYFEGVKKAQYQVLSGKLDHGVWACSTVFSGTKRMCVIDAQKWRNSWSSAKEEYDTDAFDNLLTAEHQNAGGFLFEATVSCALAIEKSKYNLWSKLLSMGLCSRPEERSARNDTQKPERYFRDLLPNSSSAPIFSEETLDTVSEVWIARGLVAHGKETHLRKVLGKSLEQKSIAKWIDDLWDIAQTVNSF